MRKPHQKVYIYGIGYLVKLARAKISGKNLCCFPCKLCGFIAFLRPCHRSFKVGIFITKKLQIFDYHFDQNYLNHVPERNL